MIMSKAHFKPSYYLAICMMTWAIVSASTAAVHNYRGMLLVRFFLGVTEAPYYPGALFLLSMFWTRKEIATRVAILYSANIIATATSGLIAAATFATLDGVHGLSGWRWLFIIEGAVTFGVAIISMFLLPDHPLTTRWLTPEERELAHARIARDTAGLQLSKGARAGFYQAAKDPRLWLIVLMQNCHLSATGFNSFFPTVVKTLGFSRTLTLVLTCPPYLVSAAACLLTGLSSGRRNERTWHITGGMVIAMIGFIVASSTLNTAARYIACFLFASGCYAVNAVILGWVTATLGQTPEKKAAALAIVNTFGNASFIYTPVSTDLLSSRSLN
jgi:MFS family permease